MRRWGPDSEAVAKVATLVRASPRVVIALGAKAALCDGASFARLARLAHAPILYRLDAKGLVDEHDPLAFGVVGVHGKPGLEHAAALVATAELVLAFGVEDHSLLLCSNQCTKPDLHAMNPAIDAAVASPSGLFLLHVLIDPLLKADMAAFIDKAAMNSG